MIEWKKFEDEKPDEGKWILLGSTFTYGPVIIYQKTLNEPYNFWTYLNPPYEFTGNTCDCHCDCSRPAIEGCHYCEKCGGTKEEQERDNRRVREV